MTTHTGTYKGRTSFGRDPYQRNDSYKPSDRDSEYVIVSDACPNERDRFKPGASFDRTNMTAMLVTQSISLGSIVVRNGRRYVVGIGQRGSYTLKAIG